MKASQFAKDNKIDVSDYSKVEKKERGLPSDTVLGISTKYGVSLDWLYKGEGEPPVWKTSSEPLSEHENPLQQRDSLKEHDVHYDRLTNGQQTRGNNKQDIRERKTVPLFSVQAVGGHEYDADLAPVTTPEQFIDLGDMLRQDSQAALYIFGNSMTPNYPSGCIIGLRLNTDGIVLPGEVYVIETDSQRILKRLYHNDKGDGFICVSDNTMTYDGGPMKGQYFYKPFEILKTQIRRLFDVTGVIKRNSNSMIYQMAS